MHHGDDQQPRGNLRPNYSCNSLQAAEQLGALMQHTPAPSMGDFGHQRQGALYGGGGLGGMYGAGGGGMGDHCDGGGGQHQGLGGCGMGLPNFGGGMGQRDVYNSSVLDRCASQVDALAHQPSLMNQLMRAPGGHGGELSHQYGCGIRQAFSDPSPMIPNSLSGPFGFGGGGSDHGGGGSDLGSNSLAMLQNAGMMMGGQGALGGGGYPMAGGGGGGMGTPGGNMSGGEDAAAAQKRRFVWTADLHSRFEAAVNALGLDNAKPKSILKLMNVDGLTKANIKSHLQKYRCLMQKKAQQARANGQPSPANGGNGGVGSSPMFGGGGLPELPSSSSGFPSLGLDGLGSITGCGSNPSSVASTVNADGLDGSGGLSALGGVPSSAGLPETLISQGESSLQRNLEVQEMTLKVQMELQEELSRQLMLQKKLQSEMEGLMAAHAEAREESSSSNSKMSSILALKRKLQHELQAHLRMQHQLLSQLNQVVLPAVERLHTEGGEESAEDGENGKKSNGSVPVKSEDGSSVKGEESMTGADDDDADDDGDDDDDDDESEEGASPKRQRSE